MKRIRFPLIFLFIIMQFICVNAKIDTNHWAYNNFSKAINQKWLDYSQENFEPDQTITKAEFLKMLVKAIKLTPDSNIAKLYANSIYTLKDDRYMVPATRHQFNDVTAHWINTEGWLGVALDFGIVQSIDYYSRYSTDNKFNPDAPITRRESITMIVRALGRDYHAINYTHNRYNTFRDWGSLPGWMQRYVNEMEDLMLLFGYPDGSVLVDNNLTYSEAVALISRAVDEMIQGIDTDIKAIAVNESQGEIVNQHELDLPVPAQIINGKIYIPVRALYQAGWKMYGESPNWTIGYTWQPLEQTLIIWYGTNHYYQAGNHYYGRGTDSVAAKKHNMVSEVRVLYGELMVPIFDNSAPTTISYGIGYSWDTNTKTLMIHLQQPDSL